MVNAVREVLLGSDPELMVRMLVVGYCFGILSERRLGLESRAPDHSTFTKIRQASARAASRSGPTARDGLTSDRNSCRPHSSDRDPYSARTAGTDTSAGNVGNAAGVVRGDNLVRRDAVLDPTVERADDIVFGVLRAALVVDAVEHVGAWTATAMIHARRQK